MALRKEEETQDQKPEEQQDKAPAKTSRKAAGGMVKVRNNGKYFFRQPSTGIRIDGKAVAELKDDNWLKLQLSHGLMEKV